MGRQPTITCCGWCMPAGPANSQARAAGLAAGARRECSPDRAGTCTTALRAREVVAPTSKQKPSRWKLGSPPVATHMPAHSTSHEACLPDYSTASIQRLWPSIDCVTASACVLN